MAQVGRERRDGMINVDPIAIPLQEPLTCKTVSKVVEPNPRDGAVGLEAELMDQSPECVERCRVWKSTPFCTDQQRF